MSEWPNPFCEEILLKQEDRLVRRGITRDDIDDIMQDVRLSVYRNANPYASYNEMNRWVFVLTGHRIQRHFDANRRHRGLPMPEHDTAYQIDGKLVDFSDGGNLESDVVNRVYIEGVFVDFTETESDLLKLMAEGQSFRKAKEATGYGKSYCALLRKRAKVEGKHGTR